jgi:hypothetical protein
MAKGQQKTEPTTARISFFTQKGWGLYGAEAKVFPISPHLHFLDDGNLERFISRISNQLWAETLDNLPPETLLLIEYGNTFRLAIDISERLNKTITEKAFAVADKWRDELRNYQGYRIDNARDAFLVDLERRIRRSSYAKVAEEINNYVSNELKDAYYWWNEHQNSRYLSQEWTIADINFRGCLNKARRILSFLFSAENTDQALQEGLHQLKQGEPPYEKDYPLSTAHLKETVMKEWRRRTKGKLHEPDQAEAGGGN